MLPAKTQLPLSHRNSPNISKTNKTSAVNQPTNQPPTKPTANFCLFLQAISKMATEYTRADREKSVEEMRFRRKEVIGRLQAINWEMRDDKFLAKELAESTQNALSMLLYKGLNSPSTTSSVNFVEWCIDLDLWQRLRAGGRYPYPTPDQGVPPGSSKLVQYQTERLAKRAKEEDTAEKAAEQNKAAKAKTAKEKAAKKAAAKKADNKADEKAEKTGSTAPAPALTSKFELHLFTWVERVPKMSWH